MIRGLKVLRIFTHPQDSDFKLLKMTGTLLVAVGLILIVFAFYTVIASFFMIQGISAGPVWTLFSLLYALPILVAGHFLHWLVAMWEARQESIKVLQELRGDLQYNKVP